MDNKFNMSSILAVVLIVVIILVLSENRHFFIRDVHHLGSDIREAGQDTSDAIRRTVQ